MFRILVFVACFAVPPGATHAAVTADPGTLEGRMLRKEQIGYFASARELNWSELAALEFWSQAPSDTVGTWAPERMQSLKVIVTNDSREPGSFRLELRWPLLERVEMRVLRSSGFNPVQYGGTRAPPVNRSGTGSTVFAFSLEAGETVTLFLRIQDPLFLYMPMYVWSEPGFESHSNIRITIYSLTVGVLLIMTLYNAALYCFTRDTMYFAYSNTVLGILLYLLTITGVGSLLVWGKLPWFAQNAYPVFSTYSFLAVTWFFRVFLELKRFGGWVLKCNTGILVMWCVALAANLFGLRALGMGITGYGGILASTIGMISALYLWTKGSRPAKYFSIAWAPVGIVTVIAIAAMLGGIDYFPAMDYLQPFAFVLEAVILSVALAERINRERREREEAQALALARQQEMVAMEQRAKEELEEQVELRTRELKSVLGELARANKELAGQSRTDPLTRLANRRHFDERAEAEILRAVRDGSSLALILMDIDHFKAVNDRHGHLVGDECLRRVAAAIQSVVVRETDLVARFGGEEFAIILPDTACESVRQLAERMRQAIAGVTLETEFARVRITASLGCVASRLQPGARVDLLLAAADRALYEAKQAGRNRVEMGRLIKVEEFG